MFERTSEAVLRLYSAFVKVNFVKFAVQIHDDKNHKRIRYQDGTNC